MDSEKYLFVSAAKGIQEYIFRSDRLKEMVGASTVVLETPREILEGLCFSTGITSFEIITATAGGIRALFTSEEDAKTILSLWQPTLSSKAPGLFSVQTVVPVENNNWFAANDEAEKKIAFLRNAIPVDLPVAGPWIVRNRQTGQAAVGYLEKEAISEEIRVKLDANNAAKKELLHRIIPSEYESLVSDRSLWPDDVSDIEEGENSYIALIHADANSMGAKLQAAMKEIKDVKGWGALSKKIDESTVTAVQKALAPMLKHIKKKIDSGSKKIKIPFRPVVCAGDDLTIMMNARDALLFTKTFLEEFETQTAKNLPNGGLTASAGIVFMKSSFPFYQAYDLCESLCNFVKEKTGRQQSGLAFWRLTAGIGGSFENIMKSELMGHGDTILTMMPYVVGTKTGPYALVSELLDFTKSMDKSISSGPLRKIFTLMYDNVDEANRAFDRLREIYKDDNRFGWTAFASQLINMTDSPEFPLWKTIHDKKTTPLPDAIELKSLGIRLGWEE